MDAFHGLYNSRIGEWLAEERKCCVGDEMRLIDAGLGPFSFLVRCIIILGRGLWGLIWDRCTGYWCSVIFFLIGHRMFGKEGGFSLMASKKSVFAIL